jgi:hypothetical protein
MPTSSIARPSKIYPVWDFLFENSHLATLVHRRESISMLWNANLSRKFMPQISMIHAGQFQMRRTLIQSGNVSTIFFLLKKKNFFMRRSILVNAAIVMTPTFRNLDTHVCTFVHINVHLNKRFLAHVWKITMFTDKNTALVHMGFLVVTY